jgi:predicted secreted hydrolase
MLATLRKHKIRSVAAMLFLVAVFITVLWRRPPARPVSVATPLPLAELLSQDAAGFARIDPPWSFHFPADHGAHPAFRSESWIFSGQLATPQGRRFGFQLGFFRLALTPQPPPSPSAWATHQVYRAHLAISDVTGEHFHAFERYSRAALGLSGASDAPVRVWLEDWAIQVPTDSGDPPTFQVRAGEAEPQLELTLRALKPSVLADGDNPLDDGAGRPFHFYLISRLDAWGTLRLGAETFPVTGLAWLDRAWGAVPTGQGQLALNRFQLPLADGRELLCLELHRRDHSAPPLTTALLVERDGSTRRFERREVTLAATDAWSSPHDGARYPAGWRLRIPSAQIDLELEPVLADQELRLSLRYWGGMVQMHGQAGGQPVRGYGQVELSGYGKAQN